MKENENVLCSFQDLSGFMLESVQEGAFLLDETGLITGCNGRFLEMLGRRVEEVLKRPASGFLKKISKITYDRWFAERRELQTAKLEVTWVRPDSEEVRTLTSIMCINGGKGRLKGALVAIATISELPGIEGELSNSREILRRLSRHLQFIREKESKRIAREIHDELGQALTALKMDISWISHKISDDDRNKERLLEKISSMSLLVDKTIQTVQKISSELRPGLLDDLGLVPAIEWLVQDFQKRSGIKCKIRIDSHDFLIGPELSTAIFRIVQEALTNVARHAKATRVALFLREKEGKLKLIIKDDGVGINKEEIFSQESLGIIGMRERLVPFEGMLRLEGIPGMGTELTILIPLEKRKKND